MQVYTGRTKRKNETPGRSSRWGYFASPILGKKEEIRVIIPVKELNSKRKMHSVAWGYPSITPCPSSILVSDWPDLTEARCSNLIETNGWATAVYYNAKLSS